MNDASTITLLLLLCAFQFSMAQSSNDWALQKAENGIQVFTKDAEESGFKPFKATVILNNTIEEFASVLYDVEGLPDWGYDIKASNLIERSGDTLLIYYAEAKVPFPYTNRDGVYQNRFQWNAATKTLFVKIDLLDNEKELDPDLVAITGSGYWQVTVLNSKKLRVTFMMEINPEGEIPAWMVNMFVVDTPYNTLLNLKKVINEPEYKNKKYGYID